jgi:hypothetical protein
MCQLFNFFIIISILLDHGHAQNLTLHYYNSWRVYIAQDIRWLGGASFFLFDQNGINLFSLSINMAYQQIDEPFFKVVIKMKYSFKYSNNLILSYGKLVNW